MISSPKGDGARPLVLITRPAEDATGLLSALEARGYQGLLEPMLSIQPIAGATVDLDGCQAILFTSANGVRALAALTDRRDLRVIAVGPASAREARAVGFGDVTTAGGDVSALADSVRKTLKPEDGALFHAAGSVTAGDLAGSLEADGYTLRRVPLYRAEPATRLSEACRAALDENRLAAVTFFSPRTGGVFVRLLMEEGRAPRARTVSAVCLSPAVADKVTDADQDLDTKLVWADIRVARTPDTDALMIALDGPPSTAEEHRTDGASAMADDRKTTEITDPVDEDHRAADSEAPEDREGREENEASSDSSGRDAGLDADAVIDAFGGIRPMASKLGVAVSTVQGWKTRKHIPENRWRDVIAAAAAHDVDLSAALPDAQTVDDEPDSEPSEAPDVADAAETGEATATEASPWGGDSEVAQEAGQDTVGETTSDTQEEPARETHDDSDEAARASRRSTSDAPAKQAESGGGRTALLVAAIALAAVVARPVWGPYVDPHIAKVLPVAATQSGGISVSPDMVGLGQEIADLKATVAAFGSSNGQGGMPPEVGARLAALESQLGALDSELTGIREIGASLTVIEADTRAALAETRAALQAAVEREEGTRARLVERLGVVESLLAQVTGEAERTALGLAGLEALVAGQADALDALEARPAVEGAALAGVALAVGDVEAALADGRPFAGALDRLAGLASGQTAVLDAIGGLRPFAEFGVPTRATLLTEFARGAPAMQAELTAKGGDWLATLMDGATSLVSVRRKGEAPDMPPVSRAEAALERGDLVSAVAALSPARDGSETVAVWLAGAEARIAAEANLDTLRAAASAALNADMTGETNGTVIDDGDAS